MTVWVDLIARARGLSGRLLTPEDLAGLAASVDLSQFATRLAAHRNRPAPESIPSAAALEAAERRYAGARVRLLARWAGSRVGALAPLFEHEDVRSLRALVRGAVAHVPVAERLAGLIPTPGLPVRLLERAAACPAPAAIAALLSAVEHPYGAPLLAEATRQQPDLLAIEHLLMDTWAARARRVARRGGRAMRTFVGRQVDAANAATALLAVTQGLDRPVATMFIAGGARITHGAFKACAAAGSAAGADAALAPLVRHTPLVAIVGGGSGVEERLRVGLAREQHAIALEDPGGPAAVIEYWLRLEHEIVAVRRILWALVAGAPATTRRLRHEAGIG